MTKEEVARLGKMLRRIEMVGDCWSWTGVLSTRGYGRLNFDGRKQQAHRVVYELLCQPVPDGMELDHLCRNRRCVNPLHLEPVTTRENLLRGTSFSAVNATKTHCPRGHEYTPENTRIGHHNSRHCRTCQREQDRRRHAAKKVANGIR